ncbi:hypothetical protein PV327_008826 [Microctonus hyperodae]|uniref:Uncharacterized protein n=1 Tax=Microctonus hyperodae TaxID=165561 RepID=A0AA39FSZ8_MICHY|nr:hypothetical protein PV327_008826 [Microctonus hyperodae]
MASTIELFGAICFILTQLFLLSRVQGAVIISCNNATNHGSSWPSGQLNRSLADEMPQKLYIQIEYETLKTENLVFFKTDQNVANSHLPVDAPANYSFRDKVMEDIGEFVMYQDSTRSSAIVYFGKLKAIVNFEISIRFVETYEGYPLELDHQNCTLGIVKSPYVVKRVGMPFQLGPNVVPANTHMNQGAHQMDQNNEQVMNPKPSPSTRHDRIQENSCRMSDEKDIEYNKDQITIPYYLETLVFISKGVTDI